MLHSRIDTLRITMVIVVHRVRELPGVTNRIESNDHANRHRQLPEGLYQLQRAGAHRCRRGLYPCRTGRTHRSRSDELTGGHLAELPVDVFVIVYLLGALTVASIGGTAFLLDVEGHQVMWVMSLLFTFYCLTAPLILRI